MIISTSIINRLVVKSSFSLIAMASAMGCAAEDGSDLSASIDGTEEVATATEAINGVLNASGCTTARKAKLQAAITYAFNRVKDGQYEMSECLNKSYIWNSSGKTGVNGWSIGPMLAANNVTNITCKNLSGANASAQVNIAGETLTAGNAFIDNNGTVFIAGVIAHEILHNRGFSHGDSGTDTYYSNCASEQVEGCFNKWVGNKAVDKGYILMWDGTPVGREPTWTKAQAVANCSANKTAYPAKKVECYFDNARVGYELYIGGSSIANRAGYEPGWDYYQAQANCEANVKARPGTPVHCLFDGSRLGYELYFDGSRVGYEPTWTYAQAQANCSANKANYPSKKVECYLGGRNVGYELLFDGKRVGFEPTWTRDMAVANCNANRSAYPNTIVECINNGSPL